MPDIQDIALQLKNLEIDFNQSLVYVFEGHSFLANPETILWIETRLTSIDGKPFFVYDHRGLPVRVIDIRTLLACLRDALNRASVTFLTASEPLKGQMNQAFNGTRESEHEE